MGAKSTVVAPNVWVSTVNDAYAHETVILAGASDDPDLWSDLHRSEYGGWEGGFINGWVPSDHDRVVAFATVLIEAGRRFGDDWILAACAAILDNKGEDK